MQLGRLLEYITYESVQGNQNVDITDICYHSAKVKRGSLFVCIKGFRSDGHDYVREALFNGALAILMEKSSLIFCKEDTMLYTEHGKITFSEIGREHKATVIIVDDTRSTLAKIASAFYGEPAKKLRMIGITGTKGKTTTAFLTAGILREAGYKTGIIGTIWIDNGRERMPAKHTTPESLDLQRYLAEMVENGCTCCVMEVSSQGIKMQRVDGIWFEIGIFLNIEPDHIGEGEHASFCEYLHCKRMLMQRCDIGIVNCDDTHTGQILKGHTCKVESFSRKNPDESLYAADLMAYDESCRMVSGTLYQSFKVKRKDRNNAASSENGKMQLTETKGHAVCSRSSEVFDVQMQLPGGFNVYNALAAIAAAFHFGVTSQQVQYALQHQMVPGRCENISKTKSYVVLLDYAHNAMSLRNLLLTLRQFQPKRLIVLFGCGGGRSLLRRSRMGETAGRFADLSILTSDNPRWEDPERILDDIEAGIRETKGQYVRITDRREAVRYVIAQAKEGDIIVLAGKGHEPYQEICGKKYPMSEYELAEDAQKTAQK